MKYIASTHFMQNIQVRNHFVGFNAAVGRDDDLWLGMIDPGAQFARCKSLKEAKFMILR
jgi:hypothetical protein